MFVTTDFVPTEFPPNPAVSGNEVHIHEDASVGKRE